MDICQIGYDVCEFDSLRDLRIDIIGRVHFDNQDRFAIWMGSIGKAPEPCQQTSGCWHLTFDSFLNLDMGDDTNTKFLLRRVQTTFMTSKMRGDCWGTWLIMLGFMDLRWPRVCRRSTSVLCYAPKELNELCFTMIELVLNYMQWLFVSPLHRMLIESSKQAVRDSYVHGANMGPTWVLSFPDGPHVGPMLSGVVYYGVSDNEANSEIHNQLWILARDTLNRIILNLNLYSMEILSVLFHFTMWIKENFKFPKFELWLKNHKQTGLMPLPIYACRLLWYQCWTC